MHVCILCMRVCCAGGGGGLYFNHFESVHLVHVLPTILTRFAHLIY